MPSNYLVLIKDSFLDLLNLFFSNFLDNPFATLFTLLSVFLAFLLLFKILKA